MKRKIWRTLILAACLAMITLVMSGCAGFDMTLDCDDENYSFDMHYEMGWNTDIFGGGSALTVNGVGHSLSNSRTIKGMGAADNLGLYTNMGDFLKTKVYGKEYRIGKGENMVWDNTDASGKEVLDRLFRIKIDEGNTPKDFWDRNDIRIQTYAGAKDAASRWEAASASEREEIEQQYMIQYVMTINGAAPMKVLEGEQWVQVHGNTATINIGECMRQNGGEIAVLSSVDGGTKNADEIENWLTYEVGDLEHKERKPEVDPTAINRFTDTDPDAWYAPAVNYALANGIISGYGDGRFGPNDPVTWAQLMTIIYRNVDYGGDMYPDVEYWNNNYKVDHWARPAVCWCIDSLVVLEEDVMRGKTVPNEILNSPMNREQAIYALSRYAMGNRATFDGKDHNIPDLSSVSEKYREGIKLAYQCGLTGGMDSTGRFNPKGAVTRAQVCQMFYSMQW